MADQDQRAQDYHQVSQEAVLGTTGDLSERRAHEASKSYENHRKKPQTRELSAGEHYQKELGKYTHGKEKRFASLTVEKQAEIDMKISHDMIRSGKYNEKQVAHALNEHSPAAAKWHTQQSRAEYSTEIAKLADQKAQTQNYRPERSQFEHSKIHETSKQAVLGTRSLSSAESAEVHKKHIIAQQQRNHQR
jgi:hypothetical protein